MYSLELRGDAVPHPQERPLLDWPTSEAGLRVPRSDFSSEARNSDFSINS